MIRSMFGARAALGALTLCAAAQAQEPPPAEPETAPPPPAPPPAAPPPAPAAGFRFAAATPAPPADTGQKPTDEDAAKKEEKLSWRGTVLEWDQSASTETVGVGRDPQSLNPLYEMSLSFKPRYYLYDDDDQAVSVRGDIGVFREFTDSDTTTNRGETSLTDAQLFGAYARRLYTDGDYETTFGARAPVLTFPTSKVSASNGRILGLGALVSIAQQIPLAGSDSDAFQKLLFTLSAGYTHTLTDATVPTNPDLERVRMEPGGRAIPGDQLSGAAFAQHQATVGVSTELAITERVSWNNAFQWRPAWKYALPPAETSTSGDPARVEGADGHFSVITLFASEIGVKVLDEMSVAVGYNNLTLQLGPDGQRRSMLYSPDARFYLTVTGHLDEIYKSVAGDRDRRAMTSGRRQVATTARRPAPR